MLLGAPLVKSHWAGGVLPNMKNDNDSMSDATTLGICWVVAGVGVVKSSGVALLVQLVPLFSGASLSNGKSSLVTPISTFEASPANISKDEFWAFHPKRVMV